MVINYTVRSKIVVNVYSLIHTDNRNHTRFVYDKIVSLFHIHELPSVHIANIVQMVYNNNELRLAMVHNYLRIASRIIVITIVVRRRSVSQFLIIVTYRRIARSDLRTIQNVFKTYLYLNHVLELLVPFM